MRVRIHLNLAEPQRAENAIKVQSVHGGWVTVAYANALVLERVEPIVDLHLQEQVRQGKIKKVPHAFLEGDLVSFRGRWRDKAPAVLRERLAAHRDVKPPGPVGALDEGERIQVGYNPRVAKCFYAQASSGHPADLTDRFVTGDRLHAVGWAFFMQGARFTPLTPEDRCNPEDVALTSGFEKAAMSQGRNFTHELLAATHGPSAEHSSTASEARLRRRRQP